MGAFHAYDIRGVYNKDFNKETVYKIGFFLPELLNSKKVLIGRDVRESSPEIKEYLIAGITDAGADVYDMGLSTTPMVYYATGKYGFTASVQITASHNPKEYNGLKVSRENALPVGFDNGLGLLKEWTETRETVKTEVKGKKFEINIKKEYIDFLLKYRKNLSNLNICVDVSNGMAALLIKDVLGKDSPELHYIFDELDGTFPNHEANPLVPENIIDLQREVKEKNCDVGVIFDGDGDRVMFVDENGRFISPDLMIALLGHYFLEERGEKGAVLQDIRSSKAIGEYLAPMGAQMHTWRVGRAFAAHKLREIDGVYGGELAGHYYFRDFFYSDSGIMACLIILGVISEFKNRGIKLSGIIAGIEKYKNSGEINFRIERKKEAMDLVRDYFLSKESATANYDFDGYRVEFPDWWFNIRPSNTEPYLRFIAEATSEELLSQKVLKVKELLESGGFFDK
ncbi:MAG: phosphoglucomutase [Bacteroidetes bacterium GWE2_39_28]|nr:MAG: phosphoglucomutase [Bacteroidetes bacterium GWE2_39_28]OFY12195.1 MAG: phosphoglucomutase [Bacteroidetes bacterium GWF2_39_10]OFZ08964.1 MAG: phosphoglucomutase [Bacteroidetes bacterium RIFOXYB2_FULL_39_7]OFZ12327.1 MAG: phosphoglucomutase [Bacteroidetes bacterium RIFOXYC2_FULL_39_11]HCT94225.1 phosphomannomutase/phosphoglucomutase [Rikenellaceae bacterium]